MYQEFVEQLDLELRVIQEAIYSEKIDHVKALCAASGQPDQAKIKECQEKMTTVGRMLAQHVPCSEHDKLEFLFNHYNGGEWKGENEVFSFEQAVGNYFDPKIEKIGNCWTRSSIYFVLADMLDLPLGFVATLLYSHSSLRTLGKPEKIIDLNLGVDKRERVEDEDDLSFTEHLSMAYINRCYEEKDPECKAQLCKNAIRLAPNHFGGYFELAGVHIEYGGSYNIALELTAHAVCISNGHPFPRANLAIAYKLTGHPEIAKREFERLEQDWPGLKQLEILRNQLYD